MKKYLCLILALIICLSLFPTSVFAGGITTGNAVITAPVPGAKPSFKATSSEPAKYSVDVLYWIDVDADMDITPVRFNDSSSPYYNYTFVKGKSYRVVVRFKSVNGYELSYDNNFTINGYSTYWTGNGLNRVLTFENIGNEKAEVSVIRATSDIITPEYGAEAKIPNFTITEGTGVYFATLNGGWIPGQLRNGDTFGENTYYYFTQVRIDDKDALKYKFSTSLKVYINGVEWEVTSITNTDSYSLAWIKSPSTVVKEPAGTPFTVELPSSFYVPAGSAGSNITSLDFSKYVSGGTKPYTYTKTSGPSWLTLSSAGVLSGTRPSTEQSATSLTVRISDSKGTYKDITVSVGKVTIQSTISVIRATSDIMIPEQGKAVKIPSFTITEGTGAYFATLNGGWVPGQLREGKVFGAGEYYYTTQIRIDSKNAADYKLSTSLRVYVNGVEWDVETVQNYDTYSMVWVNSPIMNPTAPVTYNVTFNMNGHGTAPKAQTVTSGEKATKPANPTASGYAFGGWYTDSTLKTAFIFSTPITKDTVIYAKWTKTEPVVYPAGKGDLNFDGNINAIDSNMMKRILIGNLEPNAKLEDAADINSDTNINAIDASLLLMMLIG